MLHKMDIITCNNENARIIITEVALQIAIFNGMSTERMGHHF